MAHLGCLNGGCSSCGPLCLGVRQCLLRLAINDPAPVIPFHRLQQPQPPRPAIRILALNIIVQILACARMMCGAQFTKSWLTILISDPQCSRHMSPTVVMSAAPLLLKEEVSCKCCPLEVTDAPSITSRVVT